MSYNPEKLTNTLIDMKRIFSSDPVAAVRSQSFIKRLHQYCIEELKDRELDLDKGDLKLEGEVKILTSHKFKDMDVAVVHPTSGPLMILGVRSQMSSLSKNFLNYYEMEVGEVSSIHERYPLCVVGLLYLHPAVSILPGSENQTFDFKRAENMFSLITGREKPHDPHGIYEEIAYLRVNFEQDPPVLDENFPEREELKLENFFDKLLKKYIERNFPLI